VAEGPHEMIPIVPSLLIPLSLQNSLPRLSLSRKTTCSTGRSLRIFLIVLGISVTCGLRVPYGILGSSGMTDKSILERDVPKRCTVVLGCTLLALQFVGLT
jgi:hypothetical protein